MSHVSATLIAQPVDVMLLSHRVTSLTVGDAAGMCYSNSAASLYDVLVTSGKKFNSRRCSMCYSNSAASPCDVLVTPGHKFNSYKGEPKCKIIALFLLSDCFCWFGCEVTMTILS